MTLVKLGCGLFFFFLGYIFLYNPNFVLRLNGWAREIFFNDRKILTERKKLSILFFCLSFIALFMGFSSLNKIQSNQNKWLMQSNRYKTYLAMQDYCKGRYQNALEKYQMILQTEPENSDVIKGMAYTYMALGEKKKAFVCFRKLLKINPDNKEISKVMQDIRM